MFELTRPPGGDDLTLKFWDIRQDFTRPYFVNRRYVL